MSKGVLVFARNNAQVDYCKQAVFLAQRAKQFLDLPTTIITDSREYLLSEYPRATEIFDNIIDISTNEQSGIRTYHDGKTEKKLQFKNESRPLAYELTPYDETLLVDTDVVICNDTFKYCFEQEHDFLIYDKSIDLSGAATQTDYKWISDTSVKFYWATVVFFRKTETNKIFFDLLQHIQDNWKHYDRVYRMNLPFYRNDHCFSIAIHIMNGFQEGNFAKEIPGNLYYTSDKSVLCELNDTSLLLLLEQKRDYIVSRVKGINLHVMNKFSLNRCIDEVSE
jgi:hypothetical protein